MSADKLSIFVVEILAHAPDGSAVGVDGLGLQALELEVLEVGLVALIKISAGAGGLHADAPSRMLQNHPDRIEGAKVQNKSWQGWGGLLRVAASSNMVYPPQKALLVSASLAARRINAIR